MSAALHITSGDCAGEILARSGVPGEVLVWHDILYDGPRNPGLPEEQTIAARTRFLVDAIGGGLGPKEVRQTLEHQYSALEEAVLQRRPLVLWFDACLFDQAMLAHLLACLHQKDARGVELLVVDAYPGIVPYHGLGQLTPEQMASVYPRRVQVSAEQLRFAAEVDRAFAYQARDRFVALSHRSDPPLPWIPAAVRRWLAELPDPETGLGRLEKLALEAIRTGHRTPAEIFQAVSAAEAPPRFWGDITLWAKINRLADRDPPLVRIEGPEPRLPQWGGSQAVASFRVTGH